MKPVPAGFQRWVEINSIVLVLDVGRRRQPAGRRNNTPAGNLVQAAGSR